MFCLRVVLKNLFYRLLLLRMVYLIFLVLNRHDHHVNVRMAYRCEEKIRNLLICQRFCLRVVLKNLFYRLLLLRMVYLIFSVLNRHDHRVSVKMTFRLFGPEVFRFVNRWSALRFGRKICLILQVFFYLRCPILNHACASGSFKSVFSPMMLNSPEKSFGTGSSLMSLIPKYSINFGVVPYNMGRPIVSALPVI